MGPSGPQPRRGISFGSRRRSSASPWASRGKLYVASEDGDTFVIADGPEYKLLHKNTLSEMIMATPAIGADALYIRGAQSLYKIKRP
mgnify:CR=1 FL=1